MASTLIHIRMGYLRVLSQIVICDLTDFGTKTLEPLPMPEGDYGIYLQFTGSRTGLRVVGVSVTQFNTSPTAKRNDLKQVLEIVSRSGYLVIADYVSVLGMGIPDQAQAIKEVNRSHLRTALMLRETTGKLVNDDVVRMLVCETGNGRGKYPIYLRHMTETDRRYCYRVTFLHYVDDNGQVIKVPSNATAKRWRY